MSSRSRRCFPVVLLMAALTAGLAFGQASETQQPTRFRARFITGGGGTMDKVFTTKIEITGFSTKEEINKLAEAYTARGEDGFREAFRSFKKGNIQLIGASGLNIAFHAAKEIAKPDGSFQLQLIAENAQFQPQYGGGGKNYSGLMFLVVILDLDAKGSGDGRIYEDAQIEFTADGDLKLGSFQRAPKYLTAVMKQK